MHPRCTLTTAHRAVSLTADIAPDDASKPYHYRLTVDGAAGEEGMSSDDPLSVVETFDTAGMHAVEIVVWNCEMSPGEAVVVEAEAWVSEEDHRIYLPVVLRDQQETGNAQTRAEGTRGIANGLNLW